MTDGPVVIRADAGPRTGAGHAMRCLALAQALAERGCPSVFLVPPSPSWITERLRAEGFAVVSHAETPGSERDAERTASVAEERGSRWIVLDGYPFGAAFQAQVTATGIPTAAVDDNGELGSYEIDLVLNGNLHACASSYKRRRPDTELLLGPRYALLRREFVGARGAEPEAGAGSRVLVALGGGGQADALDLVTSALGAIEDPGLEVYVVGDAAVPTDPRITSLGSVDDMPARMRWADVAVASAGSISWELTYMGVPTVAVVLAENQSRIARSLDEAGCGVDLGPVEDTTRDEIGSAVTELLADPSLRRRMATAGRELVDGQGAARVAERLLRP